MIADRGLILRFGCPAARANSEGNEIQGMMLEILKAIHEITLTNFNGSSIEDEWFCPSRILIRASCVVNKIEFKWRC